MTTGEKILLAGVVVVVVWILLEGRGPRRKGMHWRTRREPQTQAPTAKGCA